jgi:hypothetical protein
MRQPEIPRLDKTKITITTLSDEAEERKYWRSRSPAERLAALEIMRRILYGYDPSTTRLQRVLEITRRTAD